MATHQIPLTSPFGAQSTARDVVSGHTLTGKTVIVTGASAGLGVETARALVGAGARVILPVRSPDKARTNLADVLDRVVLASLDLGDFNSIRSFTDQVAAEGFAVDILINNAGIMATPLRRIESGFESQFATNHLGHFLLTNRLLPALRRAGGARVVCLSSIGHRLSPVIFDDIHFKTRDYDKWLAYGQSKTANALFAVELDRREAPNGVRAFSVHPGGIMTDLQRDLSMAEMRALGWFDAQGRTPDLFKSPAQGAATAVWCATSPLLEDLGGVYCEDCNIAAITPPEDRGYTGVRAHAVDPEAARRLWSVSEPMTGL
ncbi:MAG: oxidoreductase [Alphaproteobacteria bacterium]